MNALKNMNLPNKLTCLRMIMIIPFVICMLVGRAEGGWMVASLILFIGASFTDMLDGKIARSRHLITDFGKFMDPLADKFLVFSSLLGILTNEYFADLRTVFVWAAALVIFRELAVTSIRLVAAGKSGMVIAASWLGKIKTTTQMICIVTVLLEPVLLPFKPFAEWHLLSYITIAAMSIMTLWSGINYLKTYWKFLDPEK